MILVTALASCNTAGSTPIARKCSMVRACSPKAFDQGSLDVALSTTYVKVIDRPVRSIRCVECEGLPHTNKEECLTYLHVEAKAQALNGEGQAHGAIKG